MPLNSDTILDRIQLKSQIHRWRILAILFAVIAGLAAMRPFSGHSAIGRNTIARLNVEDVILDDQDRDDLLQEVIENRRIKALIVRLNTPGGSVVGGQELYLRLREVAKHKPVVAVMRGMATSAGYMVALGADRIVARESTITGSIGVLMEMAEVTDMAEKLGIKPIIIKSAPLKATPSPFEKLTPETEHMIRNLINDNYGMFVDMVAERRQLPREEVLKLADGSIYTGRQAFNLKLVDELGGEDEAQAWLEKEKNVPKGLEIREVKVKKDDEFMNELFDTMAQKILPVGMGKLDGLVSIWHPKSL